MGAYSKNKSYMSKRADCERAIQTSYICKSRFTLTDYIVYYSGFGLLALIGVLAFIAPKIMAVLTIIALIFNTFMWVSKMYSIAHFISMNSENNKSLKKRIRLFKINKVILFLVPLGFLLMNKIEHITNNLYRYDRSDIVETLAHNQNFVIKVLFNEEQEVKHCEVIYNEDDSPIEVPVIPITLNSFVRELGNLDDISGKINAATNCLSDHKSALKSIIQSMEDLESKYPDVKKHLYRNFTESISIEDKVELGYATELERIIALYRARYDDKERYKRIIQDIEDEIKELHEVFNKTQSMYDDLTDLQKTEEAISIFRSYLKDIFEYELKRQKAEEPDESLASNIYY